MNIIGNKIKVEISGSSHGDAIYGKLIGLPKGCVVDEEKIKKNLKTRHGKVGNTKRHDSDRFEIKGVRNGLSTGKDIEITIFNDDVKSSDYDNIKRAFRPSHADYSNYIKYGRIIEGGGMSSGRMTAIIVALGTICEDYLKGKGIQIKSHILSIGGIKDDSLLSDPSKKVHSCFPIINKSKKEQFISEIEKAAKEKDSIGGVIETCIYGNVKGLGDPFFDSIESGISKMMFSIPSVKGVEFGKGFELSRMRGSKANDEFYIKNNKIRTKTNNNGGVLGGVSIGEPIVFSVAIKPTPSIGKVQNTVNIDLKPVKIEIKGRHDACIAARCPIIIETATAIALMDYLD